ncbi:30 kDa heat shock protein [Xylariaceae sp. FL0255]|nr:30 kDa heat shock protein [Xylariaceae sp. FL0255]
MSVFSAYPIYQPLSNFGELSSFANLINDLAQPASRYGHWQDRRPARRQTPTFTPRFDVRETEHNFELHGELPGVEKDNVHIDFTDPQTIVIRGNVDRTYTAGTPPAGLVADNNKPAVLEKSDEEMSGAVTASQPEAAEEDAILSDAEGDAHETGSNKSFQATVEDDVDEDAHSTTSATAQPTPATTVAKTAQPVAAPKPASKYWVYERSTGSFVRSFTFSSRVDHDNVSASLNNGILTVVVPKAKKHESRRIAIC